MMCGSFMTSLEMAGVSLSLMRAEHKTLRLFGEYPHTLFYLLLLRSASLVNQQQTSGLHGGKVRTVVSRI